MRKYICTRACGTVSPETHNYTRYNEGTVITATIYKQLSAQLQTRFTRVLTEKQEDKLHRNLDSLLAVLR
jgi:hypothetical protein